MVPFAQTVLGSCCPPSRKPRAIRRGVFGAESEQGYPGSDYRIDKFTETDCTQLRDCVPCLGLSGSGRLPVTSRPVADVSRDGPTKLVGYIKGSVLRDRSLLSYEKSDAISRPF